MIITQLVRTVLGYAQGKDNVCSELCLLGPEKAFLLYISQVVVGVLMKEVLSILEVTFVSLKFSINSPIFSQHYPVPLNKILNGYVLFSSHRPCKVHSASVSKKTCSLGLDE